jgi:hypothetical protein
MYCIHKYLVHCKTNDQPPGFGDFLRGTIALYYYAKASGFQLYIDENAHPVFRFFKSSLHFVSTIDSNSDTVHELICPLSFNEIDLRLQQMFVERKSFNVLTNAFYTRDLHGSPINFGPISPDCQEFMRAILQPTDEIERLVSNTLTNLTSYRIIHLRLGDDYITHNPCHIHEVEYLNMKITDKLGDNINRYTYVLLSDSSATCVELCKRNPKLLYFDNIKTHTCSPDNIEGIRDSIVDFVIMSRASEIISCNVSSFCAIPAVIYDIPVVKWNLLE